MTYDDMSDEELLALYTQARAAQTPGKPLPATLQKDEDADVDMMSTGIGINRNLMGVRNQIRDDALNLGPIKNIASQVRNFAGASNPNSRNYASFRSTLEKMRNDSLRLNKGVQTEGDAVRAWNELLANVNDEQLVTQRLQEIEQINARAVALAQDKIQTRRTDRGLPTRDLSQYQPNREGLPDKPFDLSGGQSRANIPRGAYYRDKQGNIRRNDNFDEGNPIVRPANGKIAAQRNQEILSAADAIIKGR
jgi:hypothetical protein